MNLDQIDHQCGGEIHLKLCPSWMEFTTLRNKYLFGLFLAEGVASCNEPGRFSLSEHMKLDQAYILGLHCEAFWEFAVYLTFEQETWTNWQMFGFGSSHVDEKQSLKFLIFCFQ